MRLLIFTLIACFSFTGSAQIRQYGADLTNSDWQLVKSSPVQCRLEHHIPRYGQASFTSHSGRNINLDFELDMYKLPANTHQASLRAVPPSWRPGVKSEARANMTLFKQFEGYLSGRTAWNMLSDLEEGLYPTFYFNDWYASKKQTAVALSSVNFIAKYQGFLSCLDSLLPYNFEDISFTILSYKKNSDKLTKQSQKRLAMIGDYIKHDPDIDVVVVDAYTDSYGGRWPNKKLSEKRAGAIKKHFASLGIDEAMIDVEGHGERRHIATNRNNIGRMTNRRVVISLGKSEI